MVVASSAPSHYMNQYWLVVNLTTGNKLLGNSNRNKKIFIHENAFENVVCGMASILSRPQCVKRIGSIKRARQLPLVWILVVLLKHKMHYIALYTFIRRWHSKYCPLFNEDKNTRPHVGYNWWKSNISQHFFHHRLRNGFLKFSKHLISLVGKSLLRNGNSNIFPRFQDVVKISWNCLKNDYELFNLRALKFHICKIY